MTDQICLVDSNILVYSEDFYSDFNTISRKFLEKYLPLNNLAIAQQNIIEFFAILTDHKRTSHPVSPNDCNKKIQSWFSLGLYKLILPSSTTQLTVARLLGVYPARAQEIFDVYLAATMLDNGIDTIYTADTKIFKKLGLKAINPLL